MVSAEYSIMDMDGPYSEDLGPGDSGTESERTRNTTPERFTPHNQPHLASTPKATSARLSAYSLCPSNTSVSSLHLEEDEFISHYRLSLATITPKSLHLNSRHSTYTCDISLDYFMLESMAEHSGIFRPANPHSTTLNDGDVLNTYQEYKRERRRIVSMHSRPWSLHSTFSTGSGQERAILEFLASKDGACPFLTGVTVERGSTTDGHSHIQLENYPTSLANPEVAARLYLNPDNAEFSVQSLRLLAAELCLALLFLHRHGIVHRDIKPANIMISKDGHAALGGFGAARFVRLPRFTSQDRFRQPFTSDKYWPSHERTTLRAHSYAYLDLAHTNYLPEYLERADWRSLGMLLYEMITGGILSEEPQTLEAQIEIMKEADVHLLHFLQSLLIRKPTSQLCGEDTLSHPFFDSVRDLWDEIEDLQHPPCGHPPNLYFGSQFHAAAKDPKNPRYTLHVRKSSCDTSSSDSSFALAHDFDLSATSLMPPFSPQRRKEALEVGRPAACIFEVDDTDHFADYHLTSYDSDPSIIHQEIFLSSNHGMDFTGSIMEPCVSTAHIIGFFQNSDSKLVLQEESENEEYGYCDIVLDRTESSFNDSGLYFPFSETPVSSGRIKVDGIREPERRQLVSVGNDTIRPPSQPTFGELLSPISLVIPRRPTISSAKSMQKAPDWTLDQKIAISLLCAGKENGGPERRRNYRRFGTRQLIARTSARVLQAVKRRASDILRGGRHGISND